MKQWRPPDWENPYLVGADLVEKIYERKGMLQEEIYFNNWGHDIYENGASAMLEALLRLAKESPTGTFVIDSNEVTVYWGKKENK